MGCIDWQMVEALSTLAAVLVAVVGGRYIFRQVQEQARANEITALLHIQSILQSKDMREKRGKIFASFLDEKDANGQPKKRYLRPDELEEEEKKDIEWVSQGWDMAGMLIYLRFLPPERWIPHWSNSIKKSWTVAHKLIRKYQDPKDRGRLFWSYFELLAWLSYFMPDPAESPYTDEEVLRDFSNHRLHVDLIKPLPSRIKRKLREHSKRLSSTYST